jgi:nitrite reductase (NO-forming)
MVLASGGCGRSDPPKSTAQEAASTEVSNPEGPAPEIIDGAALYTQYCAMCHMADGNGVPNFQPPIAGSPIAKGDVAKLEAVIRAGSAALGGRENPFGNEMPPFGHLKEEEIKALVWYVHENFGKSGGQ